MTLLRRYQLDYNVPCSGRFSSLRIRAGPCKLPSAIQYHEPDNESIGGNAMPYGRGVQSMRMRGVSDAARTSVN